MQLKLTPYNLFWANNSSIDKEFIMCINGKMELGGMLLLMILCQRKFLLGELCFLHVPKCSLNLILKRLLFILNYL